MQEREDEFGLPEPLRQELRGLYEARGMEGRDAAVLAAARGAGEAARREVVRRRWRMLGALGMAAAVALAAGIMWREFGGSRVSPGAPGVPYARTGDIRDAYFVARQIKAQQALDGIWDADGNGAVDGGDVRMLALAAVKVGDAKGVMP